MKSQSKESKLRGLTLAVLAFALALPGHSQDAAGSISGTVVDVTGTAIVGAKVTLSEAGKMADQEAVTGDAGEFAFPKVPLGAFRIAVASPGFAPQISSGILRAGEASTLANIVLPVATLVTDVEVRLPQVEIAEEQIKMQEKQRLIGIVPNYLVSYLPHAVPLTPKQKFELAWKTTCDPFSFGVTAVIAGVEQARNAYNGYGQGVEGYANRFGAAYGNFFLGTMIGNAALPSLFKQDPRYFVKGSGSKKSRLLYALSMSVIRKGDNGKWQPNYSDILGGLAAGGLSNLYYPAENRSGAALAFENALIGIGSNALGNVAQEFFFRKLTPKVPHDEPAPATRN